MKIADLYTYPIKGVRAVNHNSLEARVRGFAGDRRFLITDDTGRFHTQRDCPALAQISATFDGAIIKLTKPDSGECVVNIVDGTLRRDVTIWRNQVNALDLGDDVASWLTNALQRPARLHFMDDVALRERSDAWNARTVVSFADAYPVLVASSSSLDALNQKIIGNGGDEIGMDRFRPNIVVDGSDPWDEDNWRRIKIGDAIIELVNPCDRCLVTTKDQTTGATLGKEPLATLATFRKSAHPDVDGVIFGWRGFFSALGQIEIGADVEVLERRADEFPFAS